MNTPICHWTWQGEKVVQTNSLINCKSLRAPSNHQHPNSSWNIHHISVTQKLPELFLLLFLSEHLSVGRRHNLCIIKLTSLADLFRTQQNSSISCCGHSTKAGWDTATEGVLTHALGWLCEGFLIQTWRRMSDSLEHLGLSDCSKSKQEYL